MWRPPRQLQTRVKAPALTRLEPARSEPPKCGLGEALMTFDERSKIVLAFARVLFINGQATDQTVAAAERLGRTLGLRANVMARWGELQLQSDSETTSFCEAPSDPAGVDMDRVASTMRAIEEVESGRLKPDVATKAIGVISRAP